MGLRRNAGECVRDAECKSVTYVWIRVRDSMSGFTETRHSFSQLMPCQCKVGLPFVGSSHAKLQLLGSESQTFPAAIPDMEGIGLSFALFVFHLKLELSDSDNESE